MAKRFKNEAEEVAWLNSKGHSIVNVKCAKCGTQFETVVPTFDRARSLKNDTFICEKCEL